MTSKPIVTTLILAGGVSGETLRCRDCGTRFLPDDLPPAEEESGA